MTELEEAWEELKSAARAFVGAEKAVPTEKEQFLREVMLRGAARKFAEESEIANEEDES